jgi:uncharacterized protein YutE (UPF0331/DUF86 family)
LSRLVGGKKLWSTPAKEIAPSTGLRDTIVHEYEEIDENIVYQSIGEAIQMYQEYIKYVMTFLDRKNNKPFLPL